MQLTAPAVTPAGFPAGFPAGQPEHSSPEHSSPEHSSWASPKLGVDRWDLSTRVRESAIDILSLQPGRPVELAGPAGSGLTRIGYRMLAEHSEKAPVVVVDVRGWASPLAAREAGVDLDRLVVVRCSDSRNWPKVMAALCEGVRAIYAEVPRGVGDRDLRRLVGLVRARQVHLGLRPVDDRLPPGVAHLRLQAVGVTWTGSDRGHGRLGSRTLLLEASGRGVAGMSRQIEVEDDGANVVRVVSGLAAASRGNSRSAVG